MNILKQSIEAVIKQGKQSVRSESCRYRHGELKCAVGHLITDEHYTGNLEGDSLAVGNKIHNALNKSLGYELSEQEIDQLKYIQIAHDSSTNKTSFVMNFKSGIRHHINQKQLPEELRELVS
jgi:hypothetical protein